MEIRRLSLCLAFLLVAVISQCSGAHHSMHRRETKYDDDDFMSDGTDAEQNDAEPDYREGVEEMVNANIITRPAKYNVTVGRTVRLECKIDSNETVVTWQKNEENIVVANYVTSNADKYKFDLPTSDLIIHNLAPEDSGIYRCTVMQTVPASIEHTLVVSELPKVVNITASDNGRPHEGSDLLLTCEVTGSPDPKIIWTKEGKDGNGQLTEKDGEFGRNSVFIKNVNRAHSGMYYCYAFNGVGGDQKGIMIVVLGTPEIHLHKTVVNSAINVEATLQCSVHEEPPIKITWFKNDQVITSSRKTIINTFEKHSNLTVIPETDDDFGKYTCQAECPVGKHSRTVELVQRPVVEALEVDGRKIAFRVHSHQPLKTVEVQIRDAIKNDELKMDRLAIPEVQKHEYEFSYELAESKYPASNYEAIVKVENTHGWSDAQDARINILEQQPIIQGASISRLPGSADISRPTVLVSTLLVYLLVRIL